MIKHAIVIDPLSGGRFLADEFASRGIPCIAVLTAPVPKDFTSTFLPAKFVEIVNYDGNFETLVSRLAPFSPLCFMIGVETGLELMDKLAAHFETPGNDPHTSSLRRDKYAMQEALRAAGVVAIKQCQVDSLAAARAWLDKHDGWPVIVKPTASAGSDNVMLCHNQEEVGRALSRILEEKNVFGRRNRYALVQEYLRGTEWVVDTVSCEGRHVATNVTRYLKFLNDDSNVIYRHSQFLSPADQQHGELIAYAFRVLDVLGVRYGSAHVEIIVTPSGPTLVELNARMHGGDAVVVLKRCNPVTQLDLSVDSHIAPSSFFEKAERELSYEKHMIAHFLVAKSAGTVNAVLPENELANIGSYVLGHLPGVGAKIEKTVSLTSAPGYVWLANNDEAALWEDQRRFIEMEEAETIYSLE